MENRYDYIIAGGGCAGLSLVWHMMRTPALAGKRILILDRDEKNKNDRTWCFWEKSPGPFEPLVKKEWTRMWFHAAGFSKYLDMKPYTYKMVASQDFYQYIKDGLESRPEIVWAKTEILTIESSGTQATVSTETGVFTADWVFTSIAPPVQKKSGQHYLLQHFKGWVVKTQTPFFDPGQPTLMDFRIGQGSDCRFMYVLPVSPIEALVEYTLFSENLLPPDAYDESLRSYLTEYLSLDSYEVTHQEFGVIPMYSEKFASPGGRVVAIGTAGNQTKASSGYTFTRIQKHSAHICQCLATNHLSLLTRKSKFSRFDFYDSTLLHILARGVVPGKIIFRNLFRYNSPGAVLRFLDEETNFLQEYRLLNTVPILKFLGPALVELRKRLF